MLQTFADQAVIAIENVRLFNELQARNRELTEALEQQTATAEILRVISSSPTDIQPVLDAVAENAARLCESADAVIFRVDGQTLRPTAHYGPIFVSDMDTLPIDREVTVGRAVLDRRSIHVHDLLAAAEELPLAHALAQKIGYRTVLSTPLLREGVAVGVISVRRTEVRPFTEKQIKLLETFADQAVIAIENVRLFNETKEALERQTATAEILRVISTSPTDVQPVLDGIAESAARLCGANNTHIFRIKGDVLELAASHAEFAIHSPGERPSMSWGLVAGRAVLGRQLVHVPDMTTAEAKAEFPESVAYQQRFG